ncbi:MAG: aminotransferase class I/II-fold pyridoxal phosphate-dependent enzyme [bacterium]
MTRLGKLPPYLFSAIDKARREAVANGVDVVDLGIGDPDRPTPALLLQVLQQAVADVTTHRYPANPGSDRFRTAVAEWLERRHEVTVDPANQVLALIGSKEGLAHLPLALLDDGDEVLVPDLGYPVYTQATILAGGQPILYALPAANGFLPELDEIAGLITDRTRLIYLNYPNNPTGATASRELFREIVRLCAEYGVVVVNDAAYLEVTLANERSPSLLQVAHPDQQRVLEFHSLSKMFNMTGWRVGFAVGHTDLIRDLGRVKESIDSGVFSAIQEVAVTALSPEGDNLGSEVMAVYAPRRAKIVFALETAKIEVFDTSSTFYIWARVPTTEDSLTFCGRILSQHGVVMTPGVGFGPGGEGWFRISLTAPDERIDTAVERLQRL